MVDDPGTTGGEPVPTIGTGDFMPLASLLVPGGTGKRELNRTGSVPTELCPVLFAPHPYGICVNTGLLPALTTITPEISTAIVPANAVHAPSTSALVSAFAPTTENRATIQVHELF